MRAAPWQASVAVKAARKAGRRAREKPGQNADPALIPAIISLPPASGSSHSTGEMHPLFGLVRLA